MLGVRREGWCGALLVVMSVLAPGGAGAQAPDKRPADAPPVEKAPPEPPAADQPPTKPAPSEKPAAAQERPAEPPSETSREEDEKTRKREREEKREGEREAPPEDKVSKDVVGKDWITPDVGAQEEEEEENEAEDVDQVIIEYAPSPDMEGKDKVTDAEGKEIEEIPVPVVSKAVEVQDPNNLEPGADKETCLII